jgi:phage-related protein (TIGR01555 family)
MRLPRIFRRKTDAIPRTVALPPAPQTVIHVDGFVNNSTGLGARDSRTACTFYEARVKKQDRECDAIFGFSKLMNRIVTLEPKAAMGKYFKITELDDEQNVTLEHHMLRLDGYAKLMEAHIGSRLYGGAVVLMRVIDGADIVGPLDISKVMKLDSLQVFCGQEVSVSAFNTEPSSRYFGDPELYSISSMGHTFEVHRSRVLHFDGTEITRQGRMSMSNCRGFSPSVVDQVWDEFLAWGQTHGYLNEAVSRVTQGIFRMDKLNDSMKSKNFASIIERLRLMMQAMSVNGDIAIDREAEDYNVVTRPMTGFVEASTVVTDALVMISGVPRSLLTLQQQAGLSAGDNRGDMKIWAGIVGNTRTNYLEPKLRKLMRVMFAARNGPIIDPPDEWTITWPLIDEPTEAETASVGLQRAQQRSSDILAGVVTSSEARMATDVIDYYHIDPDSDILPIDPIDVEPLPDVTPPIDG